MGFKLWSASDAGKFFGVGNTGSGKDVSGLSASVPKSSFANDMSWDETGWRSNLARMQRYATGQDSVAKKAADAQVETGQRNIMSMVGAKGGYNPANYRQGIQAASGLSQQVAGQSAYAQAQEAYNAQQAYNSALLSYLQMGMSREQAQAQASLAAQQLQSSAYQSAANRAQQTQLQQSSQAHDWQKALLNYYQQQQAAAYKQQAAAYMGQGASAAVQGMADTSDARVKEDAKPAAGEIDEILSKLKPYSYRYAEGAAGKPGVTPGDHLGVMAQDLEKSKAGKAYVSEDQDGVKRISYLGPTATLAFLARLGERIDTLENKKVA